MPRASLPPAKRPLWVDLKRPAYTEDRTPDIVDRCESLYSLRLFGHEGIYLAE
jgi:hypothetical protein